MAYLTAAQLDTGHLPSDVQNKATEVEKDQAISAASAEADSYLRAAGYTLPLTTWGDDLRSNVGWLAAFRLISKLQMLPEPADKSAPYINYKAAMAWFNALAAGKVSLDVAPTLDAEDSATAPEVRSNPKRGW
ncbi:MAG: phage protein Gp36 family protein [Deinococcota bacterium]